jgi:hypothetical protein
MVVVLDRSNLNAGGGRRHAADSWLSVQSNIIRITLLQVKMPHSFEDCPLQDCFSPVYSTSLFRGI